MIDGGQSGVSERLPLSGTLVQGGEAWGCLGEVPVLLPQKEERVEGSVYTLLVFLVIMLVNSCDHYYCCHGNCKWVVLLQVATHNIILIIYQYQGNRILVIVF